MKKILGLDVGVTSVGWAIIDEEGNIVKTGVRLFEEASAKNNLDRRTFRGQRRLIRRRNQRIDDMRSLLIKNLLIDNQFKVLDNPYQLREKGLKEKLNHEELATVLLHYAKRRGSSLEVVEEEGIKKETSTKSILNENAKELKEKQYVVNVQLNRLKKEGKLRGNINNFKTKDYAKEIITLLDNQNLDSELKKEIIEIIQRRRHFSEGPGNFNSPTPYGRYREVTGTLKEKIIKDIHANYRKQYLNSNFSIVFDDIEYQVFKNGRIVNKEKYDLIDLMRGKCSLYPDQPRSPKMAFSAEIFNLLNDLNNLKILNRENNKITKEEKITIINHVREKGSITVQQLLKILNAQQEEIKGFRIDKNEKPIITEFKGYKKILKVYKELDITIDSDEILDRIIEILTQTLVEEERILSLKKEKINERLIEPLSLLTGIKEYHSLSLKAIYQLNKEMLEESLNQQEIITNWGIKNDDTIKELVLDESLILSPVAKRAHREALKLVNQLIKEEGNFSKIVIETTRSKNSLDEIKEIKELQKNNENNRRQAEEIIGDRAKELVNSSNILKLRLYNEQNGKCAYTGEALSIDALLNDPNIYEIDHIIPISISFDDSYANKVLVTRSANQKKGNKTPFGYFSKADLVANSKINSWNMFKEIVLLNKNYSIRKKQNLLFEEDITKHSVVSDFINRNLVDTSYAIRSLMTTLKNYFKSNHVDTTIMTIKGKQTNYFRKTGMIAWSRKHPKRENPFRKDRNKYIHHAIDALIIAGLSNRKYITKLYNLSQEIDIETGELIEYIDASEDSKLIQYLLKVGEVQEEDVKFSWKIDSKPNRSMMNQTIYSSRILGGESLLLSKIDIYNSKKEDFIKKNY
ncbi:CRISPR-associated protein [Alteracholeplasma palmae J233]|uniref:CRISPR-associated endonuclease Cas9 n=1 Tax=Alteracholeplasma palmae (strain ATCC 49389 / J233) TaxID=1318466 RepID=U4KK26_ALTPJ|nr:type II CRISPR RNA-guided endonuclease Cas9 [Alteracholeplasma palmae]CCV63862.1 CRISPR-associated protein [Alteracholeplasma palmae J233]